MLKPGCRGYQHLSVCELTFLVVRRYSSSLLFVVVVRRWCVRVVGVFVLLVCCCVGVSFVRRCALHRPWLDAACLDVQRATFVARCSTSVVRRGLLVVHRCPFIVAPSLCCPSSFIVVLHLGSSAVVAASDTVHRSPFAAPRCSCIGRDSCKLYEQM